MPKITALTIIYRFSAQETASLQLQSRIEKLLAIDSENKANT
jgi:hypothetical protein